jgi:Txe/YoeB family toxin of Txe-Axe toxin-antitoxin module
MYEPVFTKEFQRCVKRYASIAKLIQKKVDSILQAPYHNSELLTKKKRDWRGWRSKRATRSFRIVYAVCEECIGRSFRERGYIMCSGCAKEIRDNKVIFLHVRPHPEAY